MRHFPTEHSPRKTLWPLGASWLVLLALAGSSQAAEESGGPVRRRDLPRERARWNALFRQDVNGALSSTNRLRALSEACRLPLDPSMESRAVPAGDRGALGSEPIAWESVGPSPARAFATPGTDFGFVSGRITALAIHPRDPRTVLVGAATGGIWKSTDGGVTFRPVADGAPSLAISALAFSAANPLVVYAATGEADSADLEFRPARSLGTYLGAGLLRSVDGGETWSRVDLDLPANSVLSRVLVHPTDPARILVGVYVVQDAGAGLVRPGGVYRSTDAGVRFTPTFTYSVSDLAQDPNVPDTVYAGFGMTGGCADCADPGGVYRSTDFGVTWQPLLVPTTPGAGFASPPGNVKLGVSRTVPTVLYASVLDAGSLHAGGGLFRSTDAGATWERRGVHPEMCGSQCEYNHVLAPRPDRPDTLYFGAVDLYESTDGALTWRKLTDVYNRGGDVHVDHHALAIDPSAPGTVYDANDGGLYRTADGGETFQNLNGSLTLAQLNGLALHPVDPRFAMAGTQDNGSLKTTGPLLWTDRTGSDGGFVLIRRDDPSQVLAANYYAFLNRSTDGGESFRDATAYGKLMTAGGDGAEPMAFYPPAVSAPDAPGVVLLGTQRVWANPDFGRLVSGWVPRSAGPVVEGVLTALAAVGDGSGPLWAGSSRGEVLFSPDGGATFLPRGDGLPTAIVTSIRTLSPDGLFALVTFGGYLGAPSRHVFRTSDRGRTWTNLSGGLPDVPVTALTLDPSDPNGLFIATEAGVFRSTDGGASWLGFGSGLPNTTVTALEFHPVTRELWAATYGRGAFRLAGATGGGGAGSGLAAAFEVRPARPAPLQSVLFTDQSTGAPAVWEWDFGDGSAVSMERSPRHVFASEGVYPVTLTVRNGAASSRLRHDVSVTKGVPNPVTRQVPVVLDVFGVPPTHYTSDLVVVNRSDVETRLSFVYFPAPGTPGSGGPRIGETLASGRELRLPDVVAWLRDAGYALPPSGPGIVGTLLVTFEDVGDDARAFVGSRTSTPNFDPVVGGSYGLFEKGVSTSTAPDSLADVFALREDSSFRSNLALVDVPAPALDTPPSKLSVQLFDGDSGKAAGEPIEVTLRRGEWTQLSSVLSRAGVRNGWARVTRAGGGNSAFLAYGVVNDGAASGGGTSDGSYVAADAAPGLVPVILRVRAGAAFYRTEMVLANPSATTSLVSVAYTPAASLGGGPLVATVFPLEGGRQVRVDDAVQFLRDGLGLPLLPGDVDQGGTLNVSGAVAYARTWNANPDADLGGTFGLAYPAVPESARARTEAWVYGLVQDAGTRSNLAVVDARVGDSRPVEYAVDIFDSTSGDGTVPAVTISLTLTGGQWTQLSRVLDRASLTRGYARVRTTSGFSDFLTYGVLNDGAHPGERTSDGSYVAMSGAR